MEDGSATKMTGVPVYPHPLQKTCEARMGSYGWSRNQRSSDPTGGMVDSIEHRCRGAIWVWECV